MVPTYGALYRRFTTSPARAPRLAGGFHYRQRLQRWCLMPPKPGVPAKPRHIRDKEYTRSEGNYEGDMFGSRLVWKSYRPAGLTPKSTQMDAASVDK